MSTAKVRALIVAFVACLATGVTPAGAQQTLPVTPIDLPVGRSYPIVADTTVSTVSIANPTVADVIVISSNEVVINSLTPGETDAIVWLADGARTHYRISVHSPADRKQIAIAVKFAEVRRDALRNLGLSGLWRDDHVRAGTGIFNTDQTIDPQTGTITVPGTSHFLTVLSDFGTEKFLAFLDAEEQNGNARLLAEPNILAGNKDTASFLAGGELPIPIVQGLGGNQNGGVTIQYKEYGIRLSFQGEIVSDSLIKLRITPEVSSLDFSNALTLQGFRIPALITRRVSSTLDVRRDQSLIISGMMSGQQEFVRNGVPLLKDIPILGELFSSTQYQKNETELLVIVTPAVVDPLNPRPQDVIQLQADTAKPALDALKKRLPPPPPPPAPR